MVDNNIIFNNTLLSVQSRDFEEVSLCEIHFSIAGLHSVLIGIISVLVSFLYDE